VNKTVLLKWVIVGVVFLVVVGVAIGAYRYGKRTPVTMVPNPLASATIVPSPSLELSPSPNASVLPSKKPSPSPTPKPSVTPSPNPSPTPVSQSLTLNSTASLDGWRASNNGSNTDYLYIQAGHNATLTTRGFVSFDISSIPAGATIEQATLKLYQTEVVGIPYTSSLIVDHVNYGSSWSATPYDGSPLANNIGTLTNNATVEWKDLVVTSSVVEDRTNSRTRAQFAIRFATETTGTDAWARFVSADGSGNPPRLVVSYH